MRTSEVTSSLIDHLESSVKPPRLAFSEVALDGSFGSAGRLDVVSVNFGSNHAYSIDGYEVKISRGDFTKDVDTSKIRRYERAVDRLFYAVPAGLVKVDEIPAGIGLVTLSADGRWTTARRADPMQRTETGQLIRLLRRTHSVRQVERYERHRTAQAARLLLLMERAVDLGNDDWKASAADARDRHMSVALADWGRWLGAATRERLNSVWAKEAQVDRDLERATERGREIVERARADAASITAAAPTVDALNAVMRLALDALGGGIGRLDNLTTEEAQSVIDLTTAIRASARDRHRQDHAVRNA